MAHNGTHDASKAPKGDPHCPGREHKAEGIKAAQRGALWFSFFANSSCPERWLASNKITHQLIHSRVLQYLYFLPRVFAQQLLLTHKRSDSLPTMTLRMP